MKCVQCGHDLDSGSKFCSGCGSKQEKTCADCGASLNPDARFCGQCGTKAEARANAVRTVSSIDIAPMAMDLPECRVEITEVEGEGPDESGDLRLTVKFVIDRHKGATDDRRNGATFW